MLSLQEANRAMPDGRPAYRPFHARVLRVVQLTPNFIRVTFTGPDFAEFGVDGLDQRIKIFFPLSDGTLSDLHEDDPEQNGDWYSRWRDLPVERQNPFRTYTVRRIDAAAGELDVDFATHDATASAHDGPAARWVRTAAAGDDVIIAGPTSRSIHSRLGIDWKPGNAKRLLLAGDETAAPAICSILESLEPGLSVDAYIEVASTHDELPITLSPEVAAGVRITWLARGDNTHGAAINDAVLEWMRLNPETVAHASSPRPQSLEDINVDIETLWDSPEPDSGSATEFYAWLAGESAAIKQLRRQLVTHNGIDRKRVAFMGYWRYGKAEKQA
ncbi:siderophore-interacting protein [Lysinibacter cavernae]|uniref:NADPH-dependent ferric siderophore reductase n=1 Tax=Lysinibacter cavernae TaxID=1640652 RepID=A0A7X5TT56_9MICO|nr:siderophore-interacting protein [Lysinibacter cavernae]NIH52943.1 NADPH-dependent ferric siderophore reductase [Lysinibacter cavernae]